MTSIPIDIAQSKLGELIRQMTPGEELIITEGNLPIARLVSTARPGKERKLGTLAGTVLYKWEDFDGPLEDFREYME